MVKRILATLLALCLSAIMFGCQSNVSNSKTTPEKESIELNASNFQNYFFIDTEVKDYVSEEVNLLGYMYESGTANCNINIGKKVQCVPNNVSVTLEIKSYSINWDGDVKKITLNIPVDGSATRSIPFESETTVSGLLSEPTFSYTILSVSGTVEVDK